MERAEAYSPDMELVGSGRGDYGHDLASAMPDNFLGAGTKKCNFEGIVKILKGTFPKYLAHSHKQKRELGIIFGKIKRAGFEIKDYSLMDAAKRWNYYMSLRSDFGVN